MYKNILNINKKNIPLKNSQELYNFIHKEDGNFYTDITYYDNGIIKNECDEENLDNKKGGVIVFPTLNNIIQMNKDQLSKYLIKNLNIIEDYLFKNKNIDIILQKDIIFVGYSIGNFFNGRYHSRNGQLYSNESIAIELINLEFEEVVAIAEKLCLELKTDSVLVKDNSQFNMVYIEKKDIQ